MKIKKHIKKFKHTITHSDIERMLEFAGLIFKEVDIDGIKYEITMSLKKK